MQYHNGLYNDHKGPYAYLKLIFFRVIVDIKPCIFHRLCRLSLGVVVADKTSVVWLVHSVPQFPPYLREGAYSYPDSGMNNGQTMLCVTYSYTQLDVIGTDLLYGLYMIFDQLVRKNI